MNIQQKIDNIRQKPEHIRLRWVWTLSIIFTLIIVFFWFLAVKSQIINSKFTDNQQNLVNEFQQPKKSIKDATNQIKDATKKASEINGKNLNSQN